MSLYVSTAHQVSTNHFCEVHISLLSLPHRFEHTQHRRTHDQLARLELGRIQRILTLLNEAFEGDRRCFLLLSGRQGTSGTQLLIDLEKSGLCH